MYIVTGIVVVLYLTLAFLSRNEIVDRKIGTLLRPFYRMAIYLYKWSCIRRLPIFVAGQVTEDLARLHPGENKESICTDYYVGKMAKSLLICLVGTLLGCLVSVRAQGERNLSEEGYVLRGTYESGEKEFDLECVLPKEVKHFRVRVSPRELSEEELEEKYQSFTQELGGLILGENVSLQEVSAKLNLADMYEGYPFSVEWESSEPTFLRGDGSVDLPEEGEQKVTLFAKISYGEWEREESFGIQIVQPILSPEETERNELEKLLLHSEESDRMKGEWYLPRSWRGEELHWRERVQDKGMALWIGAVAVSVVVYLLADHDLHNELEKKKQSMCREYSDVVHKLALYLGAGMTIRNAFQKMAKEEGKNPVYTEMCFACRELQAGVPEGAVYEHFGRRTGIQEYIRLSTLLTQNLKKGNATLLQRLREEAQRASQERMQYGKRLGEEAVTKLLLPMVLMLLVVMLMIMIPAFSSVGT